MSDDNLLEDFKAAARFLDHIQVSPAEITLTYKNQNTETHSLADLRKVSIITTDQGPWDDDVFWLMLFVKGLIMIPQGCPGEQDLLSLLQGLAGFDNEAVIAAMQCTENNAFTVWEKAE